MNTTRLSVDGLASGDGAAAIEHALQMVPGVIRVRPAPADRAIDVEAAETVTASDLIAAVEKAGYSASLAG